MNQQLNMPSPVICRSVEPTILSDKLKDFQTNDEPNEEELRAIKLKNMMKKRQMTNSLHIDQEDAVNAVEFIQFEFTNLSNR